MRPTALLLVSMALLLAACGGGPEEVVVLPTQPPAEATPVAAESEDIQLPTLRPVTPSPTPIPQIPRGVAPQIDAPQWVVVSAEGAIAPEGITPGDLYVVGGEDGPVRLTTDPAPDYSPVWNTDGSIVYFVSEREGVPHLYSLNAGNNNPVQRLAPFDENDQRQPALSANAAEFIFTSSRTGNDDIFRMGVDGRSVQQLTSDPAPDYAPDWSPDNTWLAFTSERDGNPEIYIMDTDGGQVTRLTDSPGIDTNPVFSPDGRRLAFLSDRNGGVMQVYITNLPEPVPAFGEGTVGEAVDVLSGDITPLNLDLDALPSSMLQVTNDPAPKTDVEWYLEMGTGEAEGLYGFGLVVTAQEGERRQVYAMNGDGSGVEAVTDLLTSFENADYRP